MYPTFNSYHAWILFPFCVAQTACANSRTEYQNTWSDSLSCSLILRSDISWFKSSFCSFYAITVQMYLHGSGIVWLRAMFIPSDPFRKTGGQREKKVQGETSCRPRRASCHWGRTPEVGYYIDANEPNTCMRPTVGSLGFLPREEKIHPKSLHACFLWLNVQTWRYIKLFVYRKMFQL